MRGQETGKLGLYFGELKLIEWLLIFAVSAGFVSQVGILVVGVWFPLVAVAATALAISVITNFVRAGVRREHVLLIFAVGMLFIYALLSKSWTSSSVYATEKVAAFIFCFVIFVGASCVEVKHVPSLLLALSFVLTVAVVVGLGSLSSQSSGFYQLTDVARSTYLSAGYYGGAALVLLAWSPMPIKGWVFALVSSVLLICILISGARGPLLFATIGYAIGCIVRGRFVVMVTVAALSGFVVLVLAGLSDLGVSFLLERSFLRLGVLFDSGGAESRIGYYDALHLWLSRPVQSVFGSGVGSFGVEYTGFDERAYPHNIIIELLVEFGVIGLFLFGLPFGYIFLHSARLLRSPAGSGVLALLVYEVCNLMKSFTYADSRTLYFTIGLCVAICSIKFKNGQRSSEQRWLEK